MSLLRAALDEYLAVRRALGYQLRLTGRLLRRFVEFAEHAHADYITTELALTWATQPPHAYRRVAPYLYSDEQIIRLLKAARQLPSTSGLRPHTYATLFGLYAATGLRANEALHLRRDDVDLLHGVLTIRDSKFGKTRYVPVHASSQRALQRYARLRDRLCRTPASAHFF